MSEMEKQSFEDTMKAMSAEEMKIAAANIDEDILWDELRNRSRENRNIVKDMKELVCGKCYT